MAPFMNQAQMIGTNQVSDNIASTSATVPSTSGRLTVAGGIRKRVVKNKSKDLAAKGSNSWTDEERQEMIDFHALFPAWKEVGKLLERSDQALRSEWNKIIKGDRGEDWQEKAKACLEEREPKFPSASRSSNSRDVTVAAGSHDEQAQSPGKPSAPVTQGAIPDISGVELLFAAANDQTADDDTSGFEVFPADATSDHRAHSELSGIELLLAAAAADQRINPKLSSTKLVRVAANEYVSNGMDHEWFNAWNGKPLKPFNECTRGLLKTQVTADLLAMEIRQTDRSAIRGSQRQGGRSRASTRTSRRRVQ